MKYEEKEKIAKGMNNFKEYIELIQLEDLKVLKLKKI